MAEEIKKLMDQIRDLQARLQALQAAQQAGGPEPSEQGPGGLEETLRRMEEEAKKLREQSVKRVVELTAVEITTAEKIYGEKAKRPEDQILLLKAGEEVVGKIPLPEKLTKRTVLYRFIQKYGQAPRPGLAVWVRENERGYPQVVL